jgi:hypothetical protein
MKVSLKTSQKKMIAHGWLMLVIGDMLIVTDWLIKSKGLANV